MLPQRLRWLLPALIVPWMHLQLGAALPAHDERGSHVSANTFDPRSVSRVGLLPNGRTPCDSRDSKNRELMRARNGRIAHVRRREAENVRHDTWRVSRISARSYRRFSPMHDNVVNTSNKRRLLRSVTRM